MLNNIIKHIFLFKLEFDNISNRTYRVKHQSNSNDFIEQFNLLTTLHTLGCHQINIFRRLCLALTEGC